MSVEERLQDVRGKIAKAAQEAGREPDSISLVAVSKTFDAESALLFDGLDHKEYVIQFVIRPQSKDDPRLAQFVDIYQHSPVVRAALNKAHGKLYQAGWEG